MQTRRQKQSQGRSLQVFCSFMCEIQILIHAQKQKKIKKYVPSIAEHLRNGHAPKHVRQLCQHCQHSINTTGETYGREQGTEPRDGDMMPCWRCSRGKTRSCGSSGAQRPRQSQMLRRGHGRHGCPLPPPLRARLRQCVPQIPRDARPLYVCGYKENNKKEACLFVRASWMFP